MGKQSYTIYDKASFIEHMKNAIPEDLLIVTTNVLDGAEVRKRAGSILVKQLHAAEMFAEPDSVRDILTSTIPLSVLLCKKEIISKDYIEKLKEHKGMTGFSIG